MTPDDYQRMNDILIVQAGDMENVIHRQAERIRDLEARAACWKRMARYYWKGQKMAIDQTRPWFDRTNAAEAEKENALTRISNLQAEIGQLKAEIERLRHMLPPPQAPSDGMTDPMTAEILHRQR
jgi:chromosome segregation ATPase